MRLPAYTAIALASCAALYAAGFSNNPLLVPANQNTICSTPSGQIGDACCTYQNVDSLNDQLLPQLQDLVKTTFFKYYKINLHKGCPFWPGNMMCVQRDCAVEHVEDESEIPEEWKAVALSGVDFSQNNGFNQFKKACSDEDFCYPEDELSADGAYVNLNKNPERFTGFAGEGANKIWASIYNENCFNIIQNAGHSDITEYLEKNTCLEKRVFFKLMSGLHSSISTHICHEYLDRKTGVWYADLNCFYHRVGKFPDRVANMYFTYVLELRAIMKLTPYLQKYNFCTGNPEEDTRVENLVNSITASSNSCPSTFDERQMFVNSDSKELMDQFKKGFRNISRIMDCVGCEKCRLWGKVQVTGLGTALKVLFSYPENTIDYRLTRNELVALFNAFFRLSESLNAVIEFRKMSLERFEAENKQSAAISKEPEPKNETPAVLNDAEPEKVLPAVLKDVETEKEIPDTVNSSPVEAASSSTTPVQHPPTQEAEPPFDLKFTWITDPSNLFTFSAGGVIAVVGLILTIMKGWQMERGTMQIPDRIDETRKQRGEKLAAESEDDSWMNGKPTSPKKKNKSKRKKAH